jgi:hypothetical protein
MLDDNLVAFEEIQTDWNGILIGNGASQAISKDFAYRSLYEKATSAEIANPLTEKDKEIFQQLNTRNFELVLSALAQAQAIGGIFGFDQQCISDAYIRTRGALIEAVHGVHLEWSAIPEDTLMSIHEALLAYSHVYSTNYDLLIYWAVMKNPNGFKDYFFGDTSDLGDTDIWGKPTRLLFLHGGLHLYRSESSTTIKRKAGITGNLLADFGEPIQGKRVIPLFITEGKSEDKRKAIYNNDYLAFAYSKFAHENGPLVILGQSLDESFDKHLIEAIRSSARKTLGIGIYPPDYSPHTIGSIKGSWYAKFPGVDLQFFDSRTHPLTMPEHYVSLTSALLNEE